jgi:hypothetical protein
MKPTVSEKHHFAALVLIVLALLVGCEFKAGVKSGPAEAVATKPAEPSWRNKSPEQLTESEWINFSLGQFSIFKCTNDFDHYEVWCGDSKELSVIKLENAQEYLTNAATIIGRSAFKTLKERPRKETPCGERVQ